MTKPKLPWKRINANNLPEKMKKLSVVYNQDGFEIATLFVEYREDDPAAFYYVGRGFGYELSSEDLLADVDNNVPL